MIRNVSQTVNVMIAMTYVVSIKLERFEIFIKIRFNYQRLLF